MADARRAIALIGVVLRAVHNLRIPPHSVVLIPPAKKAALTESDSDSSAASPFHASPLSEATPKE